MGNITGKRILKYYTNVSVHRGKIYHKYYTENGRHIENIKFRPHLFHSMSKQSIGKAESEYKTIKGKPVQRLEFDSIPDAREHLQKYRADGLVHGNTDFPTMFIHENYPEDTTEFDINQIRIWFWDIEVDSSNGFPDPKKALSEILTITIYDTKDKKYHILYTTDSKPNEKPDREFHRYPNEPEMMKALLRMFQIYNPDVLSGWNSETFDNIYVVNRLKLLFGEAGANDLSPYHSVRTREITGTYGKVDQIAYIDGIECIDYLDLYRKFNFTPRESYRLGFISQEELGKTKLEYRGSLDDFLKTDPDNFLEYNIKDVELLKELDEKLKFFELCFSVAYMTKVNFSDVLGTVKPWSSKLYFELEKEHIIIDYYTAPESQPSYEAAYVKEPIPGRYKSIVTIDATSMYPHMIMGFNVSPEKKLEYRDVPDELKPYFLRRNVEKVESGQFHIEPLLKKYGVCICGNGQMYKVDSEGIIPKIVKSVFNQRKVAKKEMLETEKLIEGGNDDPALKVKAQNLNTNQMALKILMNSLYGALGNKHFPLFDLQSAEGITLSAQAGIRYVNKEISKWVSKITGKDKDYVVYTDTDSSHIIMDDILEKFSISPSDIDIIQEIADNKIQSVVTKITDDYAHMMNMLWAALIFKREKICGCVKMNDGSIAESSSTYCLHPDSNITSLGKTIENLFNETPSEIQIDGQHEFKNCNYECESFNTETHNFEKDNIICVVRKKYSGKIYHFELDNGYVLKTTEDHKILVKNNGYVWKKAKDITTEDELISIQ